MKNFFNSYFGKFVSTSVSALIIWPLLDMLLHQGAFQYTVMDHVVGPLFFGVFYVLITFLIDRFSTRKRAAA